LERLDSVFSQRLKARVEKITEKPSEWIERYFYVPDPRDPVTGEFLSPGPIRLSDHQKRIIDEALSKDEHGKFKYSTVIYSAPKKSGKSAIASAVTLYVAYSRPYSFVYCLANDGKQSADRIYEPIHRCMRLHKTMNGPFYNENPNKTDITLSNHTRIEAIPCDAAGEAGSQPLLSVWSELWAFNSDAKRRLWTELSIPPTLHGYAMRWVESYAGEKGKAELLEQLYNVAVKKGTPHPDFEDLKSKGEPVVWVNESARLFCYWDHEPRMPWQTSEYYCLPLPKNKEDMEVLTKMGWKSAEDITKKDEICTRSNEGVIEYQYPTNIFKEKYSGKLFNFKNARIDISVTPNHRIFAQYIKHTRHYKSVRSKKSVYEYKTAQEAIKYQHGFIPTTATWSHESLGDVSVGNLIFDGTLLIEFMAWYLSEGNIQYTKYKDKRYPVAVCIAQNKKVNPDKHARISRLLTDMCFSFTERDHCFYVYDSSLARYLEKFGKSGEKYIPRWILEEASKDQLDVFLDAYTLGDGTYSCEHHMLYTSSNRMAKDLEELILKCGYRPSYHGKHQLGNSRPVHHIGVIKDQTEIGWKQYGKKSQWLEYDAPDNTVVWCPTTPNSNFYVRVNGTSFWTGNSEEVAYHTPSEFARIHRNEWVTPTDVFIQAEWWHSLSKNLGPISPYTPVVIGLDGAISNDYAALVGVTRDPDNNDHTAVRFCYIFTPKRSGGTIKISETVEPLLRLLCKKYNVVCVAYDKYQLEDMAQRLRKESLVWMYNFSQQTERSVADKSLYDSIINRTIWWDINGEGLPFNGEVPSLYQHITQAGAKTDGGKFRLDKLSDDAKIDAAVATSMAREMCKRLMITNKDKRTESIVRQHTRGKMTDDEFMRAVAEIR
jgi:hypothetical protein